MKNLKSFVMAMLVMVLAGCSSTPAPSGELEVEAARWRQLGGRIAPASNYLDSVLAAKGSQQVVVYKQTDNATYVRLIAKRWTGKSWQTMGSNVISAPYLTDIYTQTIDNVTVSFNSASEPVVAWLNRTPTQNYISVKKWTGTRWVNLTQTTALPSDSSFIWSMVLNQQGLPFVSLMTNEILETLFWDGKVWQTLPKFYQTGERSFSNSGPNMSIDSKNRLVVLYSVFQGGLFNPSNTLYVKRWNGSSWRDLGVANAGRSIVWMQSFSLGIDRLDNPIVAWSGSDAFQYDPCFCQVYASRLTSKGWVYLGQVSNDNLVVRDRYAGKIFTTWDNRPIIGWSVDNKDTFLNKGFVSRLSSGSNPAWQVLPYSGSVYLQTMNNKGQLFGFKDDGDSLTAQDLVVLRWSHK